MSAIGNLLLDNDYTWCYNVINNSEDERMTEEMATRSQVVFEQVQAWIRADGGPLSEVEVWWPNGAHGVETYDQDTAERIAREVEYSGGRAEARRVR